MQLVSNYSNYPDPIASINKPTLGKIPNPYEVIQVSKVLSLRNASWLESPNWGNPGNHISEMPAQSLIKQEEKTNRRNIESALRFRAGKPLFKGSLSSFKRKDMDKVSANLVSLWELVKNDSPIYTDMVGNFLSSNTDTSGQI